MKSKNNLQIANEVNGSSSRDVRRNITIDFKLYNATQGTLFWQCFIQKVLLCYMSFVRTYSGEGTVQTRTGEMGD